MTFPRIRIFPLLTAVFLIVPIVEIYLLIQLGGLVGVMPTIGLIVLTAVVGVMLLRVQGLRTYQRFGQALSQGRMPTTEILEGVVLLVGGALLLTPGFFTDAVGFVCLVPFLRRFIIARCKPLFIADVHAPGTRMHGGNVYEGKSTRHYDDD